MLKPMVNYYGGKWRAASYYPRPIYDEIIEPFAGGAGYSLRHHEKKVTLVERDERLVAVWQYLIRVSASEIRNLPLVGNAQSVDDLNVSEEARLLIGYWLNAGTPNPCKRPSAWMRGGMVPTSYWGETIRERIASQVDEIRHWKILHGDYTIAPDTSAAWFIDPPYQIAGKHYKHSSDKIDFTELAKWCRSRSGDVIVCENEGADWLPFDSFRDIKASPGHKRTRTSHEVVWYNFS